MDSVSLACLAKSKLTDLYDKNYPSSVHKLPPEQLKQVKEDLVASYVDDLNLGATLRDIERELSNPTFKHSTDFNMLRIKKQGQLVTISKTLRVLHVLDFSGFSIKKLHSSSTYVENVFNQDC